MTAVLSVLRSTVRALEAAGRSEADRILAEADDVAAVLAGGERHQALEAIERARETLDERARRQRKPQARRGVR